MQQSGLTKTRLLGIATLAAIALTAWIGLIVSPPDVVQGNLVRLIYVHPGAATACYVALGICAAASAAWLWPRTKSSRWDHLAAAGAEVGVLLCTVTIVTGSIWGRASWGVWWTWDARLTLTALIEFAFIGYLVVRASITNPDTRAKVSAVLALVLIGLVPVDHEATNWWQTLHQGNTLLTTNPKIHGWQLLGMLSSFLAYGLLTAWLLIHRYRLEEARANQDRLSLRAAVEQRRAEAMIGVSD